MRAVRRSDGATERRRAACGFALGPVVACVFAFAVMANAHAQIAVRGETIHTMAGEAIENGVVVITDGAIAAVGPEDEINIPDGYDILEANVVTPGLIDAHGTVGLTGIYNQPHDQDQIETSAPMQPELRAIDAYNVREELVAYVRSFGTTTVHTGHAPGELVTGQTMIVKTIGNTVEDALIKDAAAVVATMGPRATRREGSPGTRGKQMAMIRQELIKAQEYLDGRADPDTDDDEELENDEENGEESRSRGGRDLRLETLGRVLGRELPLVITVNRAQDIATALRLADEFEIDIWLDGAAEAYLMIDEIKAAGVPVIVHPAMARSHGEYENMSFETPANLIEAGIPVAMQTGYEGYVPKVRVVLFEAAIAAANGLDFEQALALITRDAAAILGIGDRVGSIEVGKDGDLALYDGDPFEYTTHCIGTIIGGRLVSDEPH